ncbi:hypothetical protein GCM10020331_040070 [Ectobacillus funiculus]
MVSSDEGKKAMVEDFKYIPAFKTIEAKESDIGPLGAELVKYSKEGKKRSLGSSRNTQTVQVSNSGQLCKHMLAKKASKEDTLKALDATWAKLKKIIMK